MSKQTKKLTEQTTVTTVNATQKFPMADANGNVTMISLADLKAALMGGLNLNSMEDGIFVMFHRNSDNFPLMVKPHKWTGYQSSGEIADGVVVVEGGHVLVVAPTESPTQLTWSSAEVEVLVVVAGVDNHLEGPGVAGIDGHPYADDQGEIGQGAAHAAAYHPVIDVEGEEHDDDGHHAEEQEEVSIQRFHRCRDWPARGGRGFRGGATCRA